MWAELSQSPPGLSCTRWLSVCFSLRRDCRKKLDGSARVENHEGVLEWKWSRVDMLSRTFSDKQLKNTQRMICKISEQLWGLGSLIFS